MQLTKTTGMIHCTQLGNQPDMCTHRCMYIYIQLALSHLSDCPLHATYYAQVCIKAFNLWQRGFELRDSSLLAIAHAWTAIYICPTTGTNVNWSCGSPRQRPDVARGLSKLIYPDTILRDCVAWGERINKTYAWQGLLEIFFSDLTELMYVCNVLWL